MSKAVNTARTIARLGADYVKQTNRQVSGGALIADMARSWPPERLLELAMGGDYIAWSAAQTQVLYALTADGTPHPAIVEFARFCVGKVPPAKTRPGKQACKPEKHFEAQIIYHLANWMRDEAKVPIFPGRSDSALDIIAETFGMTLKTAKNRYAEGKMWINLPHNFDTAA